MHRQFLIAGVLALLSSCAASPRADEAQAAGARRAAAQPEAAREVPRSGLPGQQLAPGECGLFLWSQTDISKFVFFARSAQPTALLLIDDQPVDVTLEAAGGDIFGEFLTDLVYRVPQTGQQVSIGYTPGDDLVGGARVSSGRISYTDADGWTRVLPVLGVRACQLAADR